MTGSSETLTGLGTEGSLLAERADADIQSSSTRYVSEQQTAEVVVIDNQLTIFAVDEEDKSGTTELRVYDIQKVSDDSASDSPEESEVVEVVEELEIIDAPEVSESVSLFPDVEFGDINFEDEYVGVATGGGDRAISSVSNSLTGDSETLAGLGTEGSYASWDGLENGTYEITWSIYSSEDDSDRDAVYLIGDGDVSLFAEREDAVIQSSATRYVSEQRTTSVEVTDNQLTFLVVDEVDKLGTTELRIFGIERVGDVDALGGGFDEVV